MRQLTYDLVKEIVIKTYGKWFTKPYDLNMFGIRNPNNIPDSFDDIIGVCWTDFNGNNNIMTFPATTDPGLYYLKNPINVKGTGILAIGYHQAMWKRGMHKGKPALIQANPCKALRDNNRDGKLDFDVKTIDVGMFGCDFHRANDGRQTKTVGKWSAMCQVPNHSKWVDQVLKLVVMQQKYAKCKTVSYALMPMSLFA